ncbi:transglutaminase-like cysteine peptidase [Oceanimonas sp. CHS3-5]|uniref:transglutaminase-like cysteine peptidase n=1 Tax=Oceanimonas sp. CHS3-5 TaxID=3068186 RepID=UPI00273F4DBD|nr:transglutaminase-like cysteine peptidase [Oceanimonas sp. CHS3-5]MDP5292479.1 transglutaminase-like cysteine peptidase [Oceanimonas sp. CHS3-5]
MRKVTTRVTLLLLLGLLCRPLPFSYGAGGISADFSRVHHLMENRYGPERATVSREWERMLSDIGTLPERDKIQRVNRFFHRHLRYQLDKDLWGKEDYWATPLETLGRGRGDCEDYAIAQYLSLRMAGIGDDRLRLIYVRAKIGGPRSSITQAHMVLGYYATPSSDPLLLDSLIPDILPGAQRTDLTPVFSFNSQGLWTPGATSSAANPVARLSRWRQVLAKVRQEGVSW